MQRDRHGDPLVADHQPGTLAAPGYGVVVRPYMFGQYRIQLTRLYPDGSDEPFGPAGHGEIVREMCTYDPRVAHSTVAALIAAPDPEAHCRTLERPHNCEGEGGRIRLDNKPGDLDR